MNLAVTLFASKKLRRKFLISLTSENFVPPKFTKFEFLPSRGASGGLIIIWNSSLFSAQLYFQNEFSISITLTSLLSNETWILTNIYGPCLAEKKKIF